MRTSEKAWSSGDSLGGASSKWDALSKFEWKNEKQQAQDYSQQGIEQQNREQDAKYADHFTDKLWTAQPSAQEMIENGLLSQKEDRDTIQALTEVEKGRPEPTVRAQKIGRKARRLGVQLQRMRKPQS